MAAISCSREQQAQARIRAAELAGLAKGEVLFEKTGKGISGVVANGDSVLTEKEADIDFAAIKAQEAAKLKEAWEKKIERKKAQRIALDEATALRRLEKQKAREANMRVDAENIKFAHMKALFDAQRKQAETRVVRQRQHASDVAGKVAAAEAVHKREAQDAFSKRLLHSHDGIWERRVEAERQKRNEALEGEEAFRIAKAAEVQERLMREKAEADAARLQNLVDDAADVNEDLEVERTRKALMDNLKILHRQEIRDHEASARAAAKAGLDNKLDVLASADAHDAEFDAYANASMSGAG
ncbi:hypothetical protein HDU89_003954 [Geranomyces variabilis]|nr:hypothetical protein HDU89_003954 [Geranomyces variabilis]